MKVLSELQKAHIEVAHDLEFNGLINGIQLRRLLNIIFRDNYGSSDIKELSKRFCNVSFYFIR